ncbi:MAG: phosphomannomutase [Pseudomonadota bacterium]
MPKFGTSGLRGLAVELTDELVAQHVRAFLSVVPPAKQVLIGRDLRDSSPRLVQAVGLGAAQAGIRPVDCGALPTPALALAAEQAGSPAVMVTGSHIPADRNGLKFYRADGEITKDDEARILAALSPPAGVATVQWSADPGALTAFRARYARVFANTLTGLRVGVYQHSSVARDLMLDLLQDAGATPIPLGRSNTFIPVDTEAVDPATQAALKRWASDHAVDAIISTDGDADRPLLADETGRLVPGDVMGPLAAQYLGAEAAVTPVSSNTVLEASGAVTQVARCRIGSPYVIAEMARLRAAGQARVVGYEANGGFLLGYAADIDSATLAPLMTRDFALPLLSVLALAAAQGQSLSNLVATLPPRFTASDRLQNVPAEASQALVTRLLNGNYDLFPKHLTDVAQVDTTDGARLTFADQNIVHIRPSGNAPELRCYVEASTPETAQTILNEMLQRLHKAINAQPEPRR